MNYFNYFTEIEDHFQRVRGTSLFLLSPLDWALIETWNESGVPLEAVLRGIDAAFEKWRSRKVKTQMVNSLTTLDVPLQAAGGQAVPGAAVAEQQARVPVAQGRVRRHQRPAVAQAEMAMRRGAR